MQAKFIFLLLALVATGTVKGQNENELQIPDENDNQFPPEHSDVDSDNIPEGSGAGFIDEPVVTTEATSGFAAPLEDIVDTYTTTAASNYEHDCPSQCLCNVEGDPQIFVVDCSGNDLTEFPSPIGSKTTVLKLQNNKLTEIPKEISALKNLNILNVSNNMIMNVAAGSVSELNELTDLQLANNRLIEYPQDLKNSFGLTKLEELNLGNNDMRTELTTDAFKYFTSLSKVILPNSYASLVEELCGSYRETLKTVCLESCTENSTECPEVVQNLDDEFNSVLPGTLSSPYDPEEELTLDSPKINESSDDTDLKEVVAPQNYKIGTNDAVITTDIPTMTPTTTTTTQAVPTTTQSSTDTNNNASEFSLRSAISQASEDSAQLKVAADAPVDASSSTEAEVKIGAKTSETKTGGVDKSVIGMIVAGMVVVIAGVTIKKNWSSIKRRFSSNPSAANERTSVNANGATPEEVPLQDKSPV